jgi:hypothetical protein
LRLGLQLERSDPAFRAHIDRVDNAISNSDSNNATMRYVAPSAPSDGDGKVLWMDQSENYQRRSGPEVVLAALRKHLD